MSQVRPNIQPTIIMMHNAKENAAYIKDQATFLPLLFLKQEKLKWKDTPQKKVKNSHEKMCKEYRMAFEGLILLHLCT